MADHSILTAQVKDADDEALDHWQDHSILTAEVKDDDDEAPDDWEAALEEKVCSIH